MLEFLYEALNSPLGRAVTVSDPSEIGLLRQKLYKEQKKDPALANLSFILSPINPCELWIVRQGDKDAAK